MTGKSDEGAVSYRDNVNGTRSIGVTLDGAFVPFVTLEGAYVDALASAYNSPEAKEARGESTEGNG
jgi:hypothetical protein